MPSRPTSRISGLTTVSTCSLSAGRTGRGNAAYGYAVGGATLSATIGPKAARPSACGSWIQFSSGKYDGTRNCLRCLTETCSELRRCVSRSLIVSGRFLRPCALDVPSTAQGGVSPQIRVLHGARYMRGAVPRYGADCHNVGCCSSQPKRVSRDSTLVPRSRGDCQWT